MTRPTFRRRFGAWLRAPILRWLNVVDMPRYLALRQMTHELVCLEALRCREAELLHQEPPCDFRVLDLIRQELRECRIAFAQRWVRS